jgi:hypothetical protein
MAVTDEPATTQAGVGAAIFERSATAQTPWSYQHAWRYMRSVGSLPFYVYDTGEDAALVQMRAEGLAFHPTRWASKDYALWSLAFRTRLLAYHTLENA